MQERFGSSTPPRRRHPGKALVAGVAGGSAGAWAMSLFSAAWEKVLPASAGKPEPRKAIIAEARRSHPMHASQQEWDSTMMTATALARKALHWPLTSERQQEQAAVALHYATGSAFGAMYGVAREYMPHGGVGSGMAFGAAAFVLAQEIGTPRTGLAPVSAYSLPMQANSLGEHIAWGATTELLRRVVRRMM
jgi:uncharacterized membrane protein YagU involved in acid resistance